MKAFLTSSKPTLFIGLMSCSIHIIAQQVDMPLFTLLSPASTHVTFTNTLIESEELNVISYQYLYNGGGVAIGDINNDLLPDIFFTGNHSGDHLYLNKGDMVFEDISLQSGVAEISGWSSGVTMADVNADGLLDIYVCKSGKYTVDERRNKLFINNGDLTFTERAKEYGIDDPSFSTQAAFFDYDTDGDLDLFLLNHCIYQQKNFIVEDVRKQRDKYGGNKLFRNDNGVYTDVSETAGISGSPFNFGLGLMIGDINNDRLPDIFVTNDFQERDFLYLNKGNGVFDEVLTSAFGHTSQFSMGCDMADINNDGWLDLFVADMLPEDNYRQKLLKGPSRYDAYQLAVDYGFYHQLMRNMLQLNNGNGTFSEVGQFANVASTDWSWAPLFADYDNDGYQDLYITNGYRRDFTNMDFIKYYYADEERKAAALGKKLNFYEVIQKMPEVKLANYMFSGNESLQFENKIMPWGFGQPSFSNGAAYGDLDIDGDLDIVVNNINDTAFIYRNNAAVSPNNHVIRVKLIGEGKNTFAIGAKVIATVGDKQYMRECMPVRGYQSSVDYLIHIGIGDATFAEVKIIFPSGKTLFFEHILAGLYLIADEKTAIKETVANSFTKPIFQDITSTHLLDHNDIEDLYVDFKREVLLPHKLSEPGPYMASGDVNGDGLEDIFFGGAKNKKARLYVQDEEGKFFPVLKAPWNTDSMYEDVGVLFFDADNDKDNDIYVASGGNEFEEGSPFYQDRLYINDGKGNFSAAVNALPQIYVSKSCVRAADFDRDGDNDLFVGGKLIPGKYPFAPSSFIFENNNGVFTDVTATVCPALLNAGMVNDALWMDMNDDNRLDLVITGEWMPVRLFMNTKKGFVEQQEQNGLMHTSGWWNCLIGADIDNDGDMDMVAGNRGLNNLVKASPQQPAEIFAEDFDGNGTSDAVMCYYLPVTHEPDSKYKSFPLASRDDLLDQIPLLKKKYVYYADYATVSLQDIFPYRDLTKSFHRSAEIFSSVIFINDGRGRFTMKELPANAQWFAVNCGAVADFNNDGFSDMLLAGNDLGMRPEAGRMNAGFGVLLQGDGKGNFKSIAPNISGVNIPGQARDMQLLNIQNESYIVISKNKLPAQILLVNE